MRVLHGNKKVPFDLTLSQERPLPGPSCVMMNRIMEERNKAEAMNLKVRSITMTPGEYTLLHEEMKRTLTHFCYAEAKSLGVHGIQIRREAL